MMEVFGRYSEWHTVVDCSPLFFPPSHPLYKKKVSLQPVKSLGVYRNISVQSRAEVPPHQMNEGMYLSPTASVRATMLFTAC